MDTEDKGFSESAQAALGAEKHEAVGRNDVADCGRMGVGLGINKAVNGCNHNERTVIPC